MIFGAICLGLIVLFGIFVLTDKLIPWFKHTELKRKLDYLESRIKTLELEKKLEVKRGRK